MKKIIVFLFILNSLILHSQSVLTSTNSPQINTSVTAKISGFQGVASVTREDLKKLFGISLESKKEDNNRYTVKSFECSFLSEGKLHSIVVQGPQLSQEIKDSIIQLKKDSKIYFDNIKIQDHKGELYSIPGITLVIK